jgi:hypothetical protein
LKLDCDELLLTSGFKFNLRRYSKALAAHPHGRYWRGRWNVFELILAVGSAATVFAATGSWREQV